MSYGWQQYSANQLQQAYGQPLSNAAAAAAAAAAGGDYQYASYGGQSHSHHQGQGQGYGHGHQAGYQDQSYQSYQSYGMPPKAAAAAAVSHLQAQQQEHLHPPFQDTSAHQGSSASIPAGQMQPDNMSLYSQAMYSAPGGPGLLRPQHGQSGRYGACVRPYPAPAIGPGGPGLLPVASATTAHSYPTGTGAGAAATTAHPVLAPGSASASVSASTSTVASTTSSNVNSHSTLRRQSAVSEAQDFLEEPMVPLQPQVLPRPAFSNLRSGTSSYRQDGYLKGQVQLQVQQQQQLKPLQQQQQQHDLPPHSSLTLAPAASPRPPTSPTPNRVHTVNVHHFVHLDWMGKMPAEKMCVHVHLPNVIKRESYDQFDTPQLVYQPVSQQAAPQTRQRMGDDASCATLSGSSHSSHSCREATVPEPNPHPHIILSPPRRIIPEAGEGGGPSIMKQCNGTAFLSCPPPSLDRSPPPPPPPPESPPPDEPQTTPPQTPPPPTPPPAASPQPGPSGVQSPKSTNAEAGERPPEPATAPDPVPGPSGLRAIWESLAPGSGHKTAVGAKSKPGPFRFPTSKRFVGTSVISRGIGRGGKGRDPAKPSRDLLPVLPIRPPNAFS